MNIETFIIVTTLLYFPSPLGRNNGSHVELSWNNSNFVYII